MLKGEALIWYQDIPKETRDSRAEFVALFLKTFREAGGEARALGRLSRMTMKLTESVWKYSQKVKSLIQKLTTKIAQSVQVERYVAGIPENMGFQIPQTRPATLREAMEAASNYENSVQSFRKSLKHSEEKNGKHCWKGRKYTSISESSPSSKSERSTPSPPVRSRNPLVAQRPGDIPKITKSKRDGSSLRSKLRRRKTPKG